jgi:hypothetical protein
MFHFYLSVYRQAKSRGITKALVGSMGKDFRDFFSNPVVQSYYEERKKRGRYDEEYEAMVAYWRANAR